jgi:hypothetical protein
MILAPFFVCNAIPRPPHSQARERKERICNGHSMILGLQTIREKLTILALKAAIFGPWGLQWNI